jgi:hypothetical protein
VPAGDETLQGRSAVVTGATGSHLADALADGLAEAGAVVELLDPRAADVRDVLDRLASCDVVAQIVADGPAIEPETTALLQALVDRLAVERGPSGVRVNVVPIRTVDDVADIVPRLVSDAAGQTATHSGTAAAGAELDVELAVAWVRRLLDDAVDAGRLGAGGMPAIELTEGLKKKDPGFNPVAAGFPTRLMFARYALAGTGYEIQGDDERTARVVPASVR